MFGIGQYKAPKVFGVPGVLGILKVDCYKKVKFQMLLVKATYKSSLAKLASSDRSPFSNLM